MAIPMLASGALTGFIADVQQAVAANDYALGDARVKQYRAAHGVTPEMLEALSWMGRGALAANQLDKAEAYARQTRQLALAELKKRPLDAEPHLPIALGAAIEVRALAMKERGQSAPALAYLRRELAAYGNTSIANRIQKNINVLALEGKPAPPLEATESLGPKPPTLASLRGRPVLLFFWAHWCGDCKDEERFIARLKTEFAAKRLAVIAPTQRYGYAARGEEAAPAAELKYITAVRQHYYADLLDVPVPLSPANFKRYGASTTPTLVFIDHLGIVRLYHPGAMSMDELRAAAAKL